MNRITRPQLMHFYRPFIREGDLVFDVGANVGTYTSIFLDLGARVVAVDPQPYCVRKLRHKFSGDPRVTIVGQGLDQEMGHADFHISTDNRTTSSFSKKFRAQGPFRHREWDKQIEVPITTLNALIARHGMPAFCKIDVEGYEAHVLSGLSQRIPVLSFEFTPALLDETRKCVDHLNGLGDVAYNFSRVPFNRLQLERWCPGSKLLEKLDELSPSVTGDIYAQFIQ